MSLLETIRTLGAVNAIVWISLEQMFDRDINILVLHTMARARTWERGAIGAGTTKISLLNKLI